MAPYFLENLIPKRAAKEDRRPLLVALGTITFVQWAQFFSGWLSWTCDAIDFFTVPLVVVELSEQFDRDTHDITTAITLTLLLRSVGAVVFGVVSDRFGRKWPLVANLVLVSVLQLAGGFVNTFQEFLGVRALFGIAMGGIWGMSTATAMENLPVEVRGLASGILQQGYAFGYLLAACIDLRLVPAAPAGWRALFWCAAGISAFAAVIRALLPESEYFLKAKRERADTGESTSTKTKIYFREMKKMLRHHWVLCIYGVLLMAGFNFFSHGSQDLYPTYLQVSKQFTSYDSTVATIIGNLGAITGGAIAGFTSQYLGRRLTVICFVLWTGCFIPLWILPDSFGGLSAGAFFVQFGVQGAWGVVPILLSEISPPSFRATYPGVAYQLGNMISSASAQIEATGGENMRTIGPDGQDVPDYARVQGIFIGCIAAYLVVMTLLGPEHHGSHFEEHKAAFEEGAAEDDDIVGVHAPGLVHHHSEREHEEDRKEDPEKHAEHRHSKASEEQIEEKKA